MDWRNRVYYLIRFSCYESQNCIRILKEMFPSIKVSPPYNHVYTETKPKFKMSSETYDGCKVKTGIRFPSVMISCNKEDVNKFIKELDKLNISFNILTKEIYNQ